MIDPREGTLVTNIPLGGKPEYGVSAGDGKVYANLTDTSEVVEIDAKTATVARRWSTAPCKQPVAMAIDTVHHRLFSGCRSGVMAVSDYQAGKVVATVPIGTGVDGAGYDAASGDAFASNADGTLTVIHQDSPDSYRVTGTVQTAVGSRNMGLDPTNHRVFLVAAKFGPAPAGGRGRGPVEPGSFSLLVLGPDQLAAPPLLEAHVVEQRSTARPRSRSCRIRAKYVRYSRAVHVDWLSLVSSLTRPTSRRTASGSRRDVVSPQLARFPRWAAAASSTPGSSSSCRRRSGRGTRRAAPWGSRA